jgi:hypothetical protein
MKHISYFIICMPQIITLYTLKVVVVQRKNQCLITAAHVKTLFSLQMIRKDYNSQEHYSQSSKFIQAYKYDN